MTEQEMENYIKVLIAKKLVGGKEPKRKRKPKPVPPPPPSESDESEEDVGYDSDE